MLSPGESWWYEPSVKGTNPNKLQCTEWGWCFKQDWKPNCTFIWAVGRAESTSVSSPELQPKLKVRAYLHQGQVRPFFGVRILSSRPHARTNPRALRSDQGLSIPALPRITHAAMYRNFNEARMLSWRPCHIRIWDQHTYPAMEIEMKFSWHGHRIPSSTTKPRLLPCTETKMKRTYKGQRPEHTVITFKFALSEMYKNWAEAGKLTARSELQHGLKVR